MRIFIIILWLLLGVGYWYCASQCCGDGDSRDKVSQLETIPAVASKVISEKPLLFRWSDRNPMYGKNWNSYRDSIVGSLRDNQILQITGLYSRNEENKTKFQNLGIARADSVRRSIGIAENRAKLLSRLVNDDQLNRANPFEAIVFNNMVNSDKIKEETVVDQDNNVSKRTTIYFPFNSTNKLNDGEVESYLDDVAKTVKASGEKVQLVGHTDNVGDNASNRDLGLARANVIKNYLIGKGVNPSRIIAQTKGETMPIASNNDDAGRAKNRRTELTIIK